MTMWISQQLSKHIQNALTDLGISVTAEFVHVFESKESSHGDYTSNIAMVAFGNKQIRKDLPGNLNSPKDLAEKIANKLNKLPFIGKVEVAGAGFVNFFIKEEYYVKMLSQILDENYDIFPITSRPKKILVEYSSPNIAKPFGIGHLRSTIIGDAIANVFELTGETVYRDNHLGDWGTQFGKQIYAIKAWGDESEIDKMENPAKKLVSLYVKFHKEAQKNPFLEEQAREWFRKLEKGDKEATRLWKKSIAWSQKEFNDVYKKLNIKFTENGGNGYGESFFKDKTDAVIKDLKTKGLVKEDKGAILVFFKDDKLPPLMVQKSDGTSLYSTRDLAADKFRLSKYGSDLVIINEVGVEQSLYFKQLFEVEKLLGWVKDGQRIHVKHGHYRFTDRKMSTRRGDVIWLDDVLTEAVKRVKEIAKRRISDDVLRKIAVGAIKWNDLKHRPILDVVFNWEEILQMDGNSGPYIQYTYARCMSVLEKAGDWDKVNFNEAYSGSINDAEKDILRKISVFQDVVLIAKESFSFQQLCEYLFGLCRSYNAFYAKLPILSANEEQEKNFRIRLTAGVAKTIKAGLKILGIEAVEKM